MEPLTPEEALEILDEQTKKAKGLGPSDKDQKEAELLASTKEAISLRKAEIEGKLRLRKAELKGVLDQIRAKESAREKAGKHLAVFGALYLCVLVLAFLVSVSHIDGENLAIVATLITLVVSSLSSILSGISEKETKEPADPTELMHDIVMRQIERETKSAAKK